MKTLRRGMPLLLALALLFGVFSAARPISAKADGEYVYSVWLLPGEHGIGEKIEYWASAQEYYPDKWRCENCEFYIDNDSLPPGLCGFRLDPDYCPFTAEHGYLFDRWSNSGYILMDELGGLSPRITAQWKTCGPVAGIPKADGGKQYLGGIQWQVIGEDSGRALLISANELGGTMDWESAKACCGTVYGSFSGPEQSAVAGVSKTEENYFDYRESTLDNAKLFLLSGWEADFYFDSDEARQLLLSGREADGYSDSDETRQPGAWWLRSLKVGDDTMAGVVGTDGKLLSSDKDSSESFYVRPAFVLDLSSVLFYSAAEGGKSSAAVGGGEFGTFSASSDSGRKLTLLDGARSGFTAGAAKSTVRPGCNLAVAYSGANIGTGEYVSAMLCGADGAALYYASLTSAGSGIWNMTIPDGLAEGTYTLKMFSEQQNGDYETDYASTFVSIPLTVSNTAPMIVAVTVTPEAGGTVTGAGEYEEDAAVTLAAAPNEGYVFKEWLVLPETVTITDNLFTMPASDVTVTAVFEPIPSFGPAALTLPAALTTIEASAFAGDAAVTIVDAKTCTSIGANAFKDTGLTQIRLPKSCAIDLHAFEGCGIVFVFAPAGGTTETYCQSHADRCVFVEIAGN